MNIKLSDFILEQTVSTASIIDIELEQAVAEVEVGSALLEAYFKQAEMYEIYQEEFEIPKGSPRENSERNLENFRQSKEKSARTEEEIRQALESPAEASEPKMDAATKAKLTSHRDEQDHEQAEEKHMPTAPNYGDNVRVSAMFDKGIKAFFKGIGSWFVKIWTKFIGWISEKRIDSLIKRLDKMTPSDRQTMKVEINLNYNTRVEKDEELSGTALDQTQTYYDVGFILDTGKDFIDILTKIKDGSVKGDELNTLISEINDFKHNLGNTRKFNNDNPKTKTVNGDELRTILRSIRDQVDKNKDHIKQLRNEITKNKDIGEQLAKKFGHDDDKAGKRVYRSIKSSYSAYSTYMSYQMTSLMKLISESNVKNEMKNPSGKSKDTPEADENQPIGVDD